MLDDILEQARRIPHKATMVTYNAGRPLPDTVTFGQLATLVDRVAGGLPGGASWSPARRLPPHRGEGHRGVVPPVAHLDRDHVVPRDTQLDAREVTRCPAVKGTW